MLITKQQIEIKNADENIDERILNFLVFFSYLIFYNEITTSDCFWK